MVLRVLCEKDEREDIPKAVVVREKKGSDDLCLGWLLVVR